MSDDDLLNASMTIVPRFLIGEFRYEDGLTPGVDRVTQFARQLLAFKIHGKGVFDGLTIPVGGHNCSDKDCENITDNPGPASAPRLELH